MITATANLDLTIPEGRAAAHDALAADLQAEADDYSCRISDTQRMRKWMSAMEHRARARTIRWENSAANGSETEIHC